MGTIAPPTVNDQSKYATGLISSGVPVSYPPKSSVPNGPAGGDLNGTYPNPTVDGINGAAIPISASLLGSNAQGQLIVGTGSGGGGAPTGPATGDLAGSYPAPTVDGINGVNLATLGAGLLKQNASGIPAIAAQGTDYTNPSQPVTFSAAGAASIPGMTVSGAPYTAGTATTNTPQLYLNSGVAPTTWSAAGTALGVNAPSGFAGNLIDCHINGGASIFSVASNGVIAAAGLSTTAASNILAGTTAGLQGSGVSIGSTSNCAWSSTTTQSGSKDTTISRQAAGILQINNGSTNSNTGALSLGQVLLNGGTAAASTSQLSITTAPYTAGTATTNFPVAYLNSGATAPTTFSTAGTMLGFNAPSGFTGNFLDCHVNGGGSAFSIASTGAMVSSSQITCSASQVILNGAVFLRSSGTSLGIVGWSSAATAGSVDTCLSRASAGVVQIGTSNVPGSTGSLQVGQILGGSGAPSIAAGTAAGTSPTVSVSGSNLHGQVNLTTGSAPAASAAAVTVTFAGSFSFPTAPFVVFSPANAAAAALTGNQAIFVTSTQTTFALNAGSSALAATTQYLWNYHVGG